MRVLTKEQMLQALTKSGNKLIAERAKEALQGNEIDTGSFFGAVLSGNFAEAVQRADSENLKTLEGFDLSKEIIV